MECIVMLIRHFWYACLITTLCKFQSGVGIFLIFVCVLIILLVFSMVFMFHHFIGHFPQWLCTLFLITVWVSLPHDYAPLSLSVCIRIAYWMKDIHCTTFAVHTVYNLHRGIQFDASFKAFLCLQSHKRLCKLYRRTETVYVCVSVCVCGGVFPLPATSQKPVKQ